MGESGGMGNSKSHNRRSLTAIPPRLRQTEIAKIERKLQKKNLLYKNVYQASLKVHQRGSSNSNSAPSNKDEGEQQMMVENTSTCDSLYSKQELSSSMLSTQTKKRMTCQRKIDSTVKKQEKKNLPKKISTTKQNSKNLSKKEKKTNF